MMRTLILSAELSSVKDNSYNNKKLRDLLEAEWFGFDEAQGSYKGAKESSVVIPLNNDHQFDRLLTIAFGIFYQESILCVEKDGEAKLIYNDYSYEDLGRFTCVSKEEAESQEAFTFIESLGTYWICK
jgi:hypothetical protein